MKCSVFQYSCSILAFVSLVSDCHAYLPVYGSPGYTPGVGGYIVSVGLIDNINNKISVNDAGITVASASRYNGSGNPIDERALRWSSTVGVELGHLGTSGGLAFSSVRAINHSDVAVGEAVIGFSDSHAVRWNGPGTAATLLATPAGHAGTRLQDINASGTSLGMGFPTGGMGVHPVRWNDLGTPTVLPRPSGYPNAEAYAINDAEMALGRAFTDSDDRAVRWDAVGTLTDLGHLGLDADGNTFVQPNTLNSSGTAVGHAAKHDMAGNYLGTVPVRWEASGIAAVELDTLGPYPSAFQFGDVRAINDAGVAIGYVHKSPAFPTDEFGTRAARWDPAGTAVTSLGQLGTAPNGGAYAVAHAINTSGLIVGTATQYNVVSGFLDFRAVLWRTSGVAVDLNSLIDPASGWELTNAHAVSNTGWIAGEGYFDSDGAGGQNPYGRYFLLQILEILSGDFDIDGDVDGRDFLFWQRGGSPNGNNSGDLALWQAQYGTPALSTSLAVPEPKSWLLLLLVGGIAIGRIGMSSRT